MGGSPLSSKLATVEVIDAGNTQPRDTE